MQEPQHRKPGEAAFAVLVAAASLFLLYSAYGISGFEALSAPGAIPMAATATMLITSLIVLVRTFGQRSHPAASFRREILPVNVAIVAVMLVVYAFLLKPLGFLPTSALFLIACIKLLGRRSWGFSVGIGLFSLLVIYLVFRIVFTVLMPAGVVPEGEILAWFRSLFKGGV
jgi:hypothetical protein